MKTSVRAPGCSASACAQANGGAVVMEKGELVFDGVAISDTSATVRDPPTRAGRPVGLCVGAGLHRTGAVCRILVAQYSCSMARSHSEGAARSRARGRYAWPGAHAITQPRTCGTSLRCWQWHWFERLI